mmetsp:Transcript_3403/g.7968  ORF Transcript_3403/g.7968 Transcript_3403/m.7968 type:complete len:906 (-) Transcript_3403:341-3058(-)|eukprot:CAMPEP_0114498792 /NCGR_PEP_ID=MMETSP0109-20121206/7065_1 /TAXON_ID=29199 /ORGANISM="Chlorarachnion reptans, Strain CCCM449" /LENGTH=905 /DNA_ID=CAMNT_0001676301 /DNA_START=91 /DNA_END=2808 /DNA_ORIENTATION=-
MLSVEQGVIGLEKWPVDSARWKNAIAEAEEAGRRGLAVRIERLVTQAESVQKDKAKEKHDIEQLKDRIRSLKRHQVGLKLIREVAEKCSHLSTQVQNVNLAPEAATQLMALNTSLEENVATHPSLKRSKHLQKLRAKIVDIRKRICEGLESSAEDLRFLIQNDSTDVQYVNQAKGADSQNDVVVYTLRVPAKAGGEGESKFHKHPDQILKAAGELSQYGTMHRCIKHIAARIEKELFRPLVSAASTTFSHLIKRQRGWLPAGPTILGLDEPTLPSGTRSVSSCAKTWELFERETGLLLAIYEKNDAKLLSNPSLNDPDNDQQCSEEARTLMRDIAKLLGAAATVAVGGHGKDEGSLLEALGHELVEPLEKRLVEEIMIPCIPRDATRINAFRKVCEESVGSFRSSLEAFGLLVPGGPTAAEAARKRLDESLRRWLSGIQIGGRESRMYDPTELVDFGVSHGLTDQSPEEVYRQFVDKKHKMGMENAHVASSEAPDFGSLQTRPPFPDSLTSFLEEIDSIRFHSCKSAAFRCARNIIINSDFKPYSPKGALQDLKYDRHTDPLKLIEGPLSNVFPSSPSGNLGQNMTVSEGILKFLQVLYAVAAQAKLSHGDETTNQNYIRVTGDIAQLYLALVLPTYAPRIPELPHLSALVRNDTRLLAASLAHLQFELRFTAAGASDESKECISGQHFKKGSIRLIDLVPPLENLATRVFALQLDALNKRMRTILKPVRKQPLQDLQIASRHEEVREAITAALEIPRRLLRAWGGAHPLLEASSRQFIISRYIEMICTALTAGILEANDISQECAARIRALLSGVIFLIEGKDPLLGSSNESLELNVSSLGKIRDLYMLLGEDQTLTSVRISIDRLEITSLTENEIASIIQAVWSKSPKRDDLIENLLNRRNKT